MTKVVVGVKSARKALVFVLLGATIEALVTTGVAAATSSKATPAKAVASVVITTKTLPKLGAVLVNSQGYTLYMFMPDGQKKVTCVHSCAAVWPPAKLPSGAKLVAEGGVKTALLGSDPNPAG